MARITKQFEFREIGIDELTLGSHQARKSELEKDIEELMDNIELNGLFHPIIVCPQEDTDLFEIIAGQRRFLVHDSDHLDRETIMCRAYLEPLTPAEKVAISYSENIMRNPMVRNDHIDVCSDLFLKYGTFKKVSDETGIPARLVSKYVKSERLTPDVKEAVKTGQISMDSALRATEAVEAVTGEGKGDPVEIMKFATAMSGMSDSKQKKVRKIKIENPELDLEETVEQVEGEKSVQIYTELSSAWYSKFEGFVERNETTKPAAVHDFVTDGLTREGFAPE